MSLTGSRVCLRLPPYHRKCRIKPGIDHLLVGMAPFHKSAGSNSGRNRANTFAKVVVVDLLEKRAREGSIEVMVETPLDRGE